MRLGDLFYKCTARTQNIALRRDELFNREDICLQTLLLLFKYANHKNKRSFVSTANEALVGTLMTIGDVNNILSIVILCERIVMDYTEVQIFHVYRLIAAQIQI